VNVPLVALSSSSHVAGVHRSLEVGYGSEWDTEVAWKDLEQALGEQHADKKHPVADVMYMLSSSSRAHIQPPPLDGPKTSF